MIKLVSKVKLAVIVMLVFCPMVVGAAPVLWSGDNGGQLGTVDLSTGDVNVVGDMGVAMWDIALDPSGNLWGISYDVLYRIDKDTAEATRVGELGVAANSLVFDSSGVLYAANNALYSVDTTTGAAARIGNGGDSYASSGDLAFMGDDLYLSSKSCDDGDCIVKIDTSDGSGNEIGAVGASGVFGLASSDDENLFGLTGTKIIAIDPETGSSSELLDYSGNGLGNSYGCAYETQPVPVPAAVWFLGSGLLALARFRRHNQ